jgi:molybdopterin-guanine dinucleotide biosynthesis protein B
MRTVVVLAGTSGSGKTTLAEKLIRRLVAHRRRVAYVKHDAHRFEMDRRGKDTWRAMHAGASAVAIASAEQWAWLGRVGIPDIEELVRRALRLADVCLIEGYHGSRYRKVLVVRRGVPLRIVRPARTIVATYGDSPRRRRGAPRHAPHFAWGEADALAAFLFPALAAVPIVA